jgi:hypothetical protein
MSSFSQSDNNLHTSTNRNVTYGLSSCYWGEKLSQQFVAPQPNKVLDNLRDQLINKSKVMGLAHKVAIKSYTN